MNSLYTIGHSNHSLEKFLALLARHSIEVVCDVRSSPASRRLPQFDGHRLRESLSSAGIQYIFLGDSLGGRGKVPSDYVRGRVSYARLAGREDFALGLDRVRAGAAKYRVALMCAEKDPANCHRAILVSRHLRNDNVHIKHILEDGSLEGHESLEVRLLRLNALPEKDLFESTDTLIAQAYSLQEAKIAFEPPSFRDQHGQVLEEKAEG